MPHQEPAKPELPGDKATESNTSNDTLSARRDIKRAPSQKDLTEVEDRRTSRSTGSFDSDQEMSIEIDLGQGQIASRRDRSETINDIAKAEQKKEDFRSEAIKMTPAITDGSTLKAGLIYDENPLKYSGVKNIGDVTEKFAGVGEGLAETFNEGIAAAAKDPQLVNKGLVETFKSAVKNGTYLFDKVLKKDWSGLEKDTAEVVEHVIQASDSYSAMSQHEQGKVIGQYFMPALTPDLPGIVEEAKALKNSDSLIVAVEKKALAGKGGEWPTLNPRYAEDVVKQLTPQSCVSACGEMISEGRLKQSDLLELLGAPTDTRHLAKALGDGWRGRCFPELEPPRELFSSGPWVANLQERYVGHRASQPHAVVINGLNEANEVMISDPWDGTRYEMTMKNFELHWTGTAVFKNNGVK